ncbi:MAG: hypothetical protein C0498_01555 [Anaerolinea sp.]|nr:hypothetical protein [Anaerolinea sp.]
MSAAYKFSRRLTAAIAARGTSHTQVGEALGVSRQRVREWTTGALPTVANAARLAEALADESLLVICREARTRACLSCGRSFLAENRRRRFCGPVCGSINLALRGRVKTASLGERRLGLLEGAVESFCVACEPALVCRDAGCPLRPVSPLPLAAGATEVSPRRTCWSNPGRVAGARARMTELWRDPEWRARRVRAIAAGRRAG